jgi:hypothetical protein
MPSQRHTKTRGACALLALALWLGSLGLSAFPTLHALAHSDASSPDHHCVVTQIEGHSLLAALAQTLAPAVPANQFGSVLLPSVPVLLRPDYRLDPNRGPPSLLVSSQVVG